MPVSPALLDIVPGLFFELKPVGVTLPTNLAVTPGCNVFEKCSVIFLPDANHLSTSPYWPARTE
jgi:hypothetical protein